ncbi:hypothetical protein HPB48_008344 [Haemaphysalis longicornis]|uniref:Uncharacterized protein n=1 Tax=Haemaphysalis longicornis TaxID=44386 RepID=A0A9J6FZS6_HAELO|nr:hypothetical protein HPB48_008344 [Haemaphysalis longicornis]
MKFMNETFEDLKTEKEQLLAANKDVTAQNLALEQKLAELEECSRRNNRSIRVPCTQGEDCLAVIKTIASKIACPLTDTDIDVVHRVPSTAN